MSWIRKTAEQNLHRCGLPTRDEMRRLPPSLVSAKGRSEFELAQDKRRGYVEIGTGRKIPDGRIGDIWLCNTCGVVWIIRNMPVRRSKRGHTPHGVTPVWRMAGWLDKFRNRKIISEVRDG